MSFDLQKILDSKRAYRHTLATRDLGEKLRMLDALRERALTLRPARAAAIAANVLREAAPPYGARLKEEL